MARSFEKDAGSAAIGSADDASRADVSDTAPSDADISAQATSSANLAVTDSSGLFTVVAALSWGVLVMAPLLISIGLDTPLSGLPLLGVVLWLLFLRIARWLSPAARADALMQRGRYAEALMMCDHSLSVTGPGAWVGRRRLVWLNRRVVALLGLGRYDEALIAAIEAVETSPDPETIANCAVALLRLNRYDLALEAGRMVSQLTHGRSVRANTAMAWAMLAKGFPAEAEALAHVSLYDIQALTPYVRRENHAASLSALCRAQRALDLTRQASATLARLRKVTRGSRPLAAVLLLEEADILQEEPKQASDRVARARASDPAYTVWYLSQPGALLALRDEPSVAQRVTQAELGIARMSSRAPDDEVVHRLLHSLRPEASASPAYQSSSSALTAQIVTLGATLALLLLWMWRFFISQTL